MVFIQSISRNDGQQFEMLMNVVGHDVDPIVASKIINGLPPVVTAKPPVTDAS